MAFNLKKILNITIGSIMAWVVGFLLLLTWVEADSFQKSNRNSEIQNQDAIIISQNEPDNSSDSEKTDSTNPKKNLDTENRKAEKKEDKTFVPSDKIGAEQAIAFPYDI
jgi:hypothetical protein